MDNAAVSDSTRVQREADLVAYYDNELAYRVRRELSAQRLARRGAYLELLHREGRLSVLEIGSGPGRDGTAFAAAGVAYTGVDLAPGSVDACRSLGLDAHVASVLDLPFADGAFDAGWTMSTLLHVANADFDTALSEIVRVLWPGAPLAIGLWGASEGREEFWDEGADLGPPRFFSIRDDAALHASLRRFGSVEEAATWPGQGSLHYQWAVLRTTGPTWRESAKENAPFHRSEF